jgi:drug/metabolite transporter (DMT)-like permease
VIAVLLGVWLAGETIGPREVLAMLIILGSVVLLTTAGKPAKPLTKIIETA